MAVFRAIERWGRRDYQMGLTGMSDMLKQQASGIRECGQCGDDGGPLSFTELWLPSVIMLFVGLECFSLTKTGTGPFGSFRFRSCDDFDGLSGGNSDAFRCI